MTRSKLFILVSLALLSAIFTGVAHAMPDEATVRKACFANVGSALEHADG